MKVQHILNEHTSSFTPTELVQARATLDQYTDQDGNIDLQELMDKEQQLSPAGMMDDTAQFSTKTVSLFDLYPSQDVVERKWVDAVLNGSARTQKLPVVAIVDQPTIVDGHHRIAAALAAGRKSIDVQLTRYQQDGDEMEFVAG